MIKSSLFILALLTLSLFICQTNSLSLKKKSSKAKSLSSLKKKFMQEEDADTGMIVSARSKILSIKKNDDEIELSGLQDLDRYQVAKIFQHLFREGDKIEITAENSSTQQAGIVTAIFYLSKDNEVLLLPSSADWFCDNSPAVSVGDYNQANSFGPITLEDLSEVGIPSGNWIWSKDLQKTTTTCSVKLGPIGQEESTTTDASELKEDLNKETDLNKPTEPITKPITEPITEPITKPITEPITEPIIKPITEPITEPITKPIIAVDPIAEPITEPITKPITEPVTEPVTEPITKPDASLNIIREEEC